MSIKKALITGHKGFVGNYFVNRLSNDGYNITGIDIKDGNDIRDFLKNNESYYDVVIHLAAVVGGRQTIENSPLSVAIDLSIDSEFFNWILKTKPGHTIYFSSSAAYPIKYQTKNSKIKLPENYIDLNNIRSPDYTYGWAKLTGEYLAKFVSKDYNKITILRPFSGYGTDQDLSYPFPSFIERAKNKDNPFVIWGNGQQVRDFIHIRDIVNMVMLCINDHIYGTYNIGSGLGISFNDLCNIMCNIMGYTPIVEHLKDRPSGVMYRVADIKKMSTIFSPQITLEQGIKMALDNII